MWATQTFFTSFLLLGKYSLTVYNNDVFIDEKKDRSITWGDATRIVAIKLMGAYGEEMGRGAAKFFAGEVDDVYSPGDWFPHILEKIDDRDLVRFAAHGIVRGGEEEQLQALLAILTTGQLRGDWASIRGSGYVDAYITGGFTLISPIDEGLVNATGKLSIGTIVANPYFEPLIPILMENFPKFKFIKAEQFPNWLEDQKKK